MQFLSTSLVIDLQRSLIRQFGGLHGIRDKGLLESALAYPQLLYSIGTERDIFILAASYSYHLIHNHPFLDGNKRIGVLAMLTFLRTNGIVLQPPKTALYDLAIQITIEKTNEEEIAAILKTHVSPANA